MNNEEKILSVLDTIKASVGTLILEQKETNKRLDKLGNEVSSLRERIKVIDSKKRKIS